METVIHPDDYIKHTACAYPSLFLSSCWNVMKFAVLDHCFNTIGNSVNFDNIDELTCKQYDNEFAEKLYSGNNLHEGWLKQHCELYFDEWFPSSHHLQPDCVTFEKDKHRHIHYWCTLQPIDTYTPYKNFDSKYSAVYKYPCLLNHQHWVDALIWYYTKCRQLFTNPTIAEAVDLSYYGYNIFPTHDEHEDSELQAGDYTRDELIETWNKEKQQYLQFINETLHMVRTMRRRTLRWDLWACS
jgi:hypothetical protein